MRPVPLFMGVVMTHRLHLLLAAGLGAMSIGASAAAVHDWTATRIGVFEADLPLLPLGVAGMNNAGQVIGFVTTIAFQSPLPDYGPAFLYSPGSPGRLVQLGPLRGALTFPTR